MQLKDILLRFNVGNFGVYLCLLAFFILLSLRVEGVLRWNYAAIFIPLWVWNVMVWCAMAVGIVFWIKKKSLRQDSEHVHHFKAMVVSVCLQFPLFLTEVLIVIQLETGRLSWRALFTPLYLLCGLTIGSCVWACWRRRSIDLELLGMLNLLQLIFLGIQLDGIVSWAWAIVLIPSWILLGAFFAGLAIYSCVLFIVYKVGDNQHELNQKKVPDMIKVTSALTVAVFLVLFLALLISQLDGRIDAPYPAIFVPLHIAVIALLASTITRNPGNPWWFGIRKNFIDFLLDTCPVLQEYANISYQSEDRETLRRESKKKPKQQKAPLSPPPDIFPYEDILTPD